MFKPEDLRLGMKVLVFNFNDKTCAPANIIALSAQRSILQIIVNCYGQEISLSSWDYKRDYYELSSRPSWCFPDSTKYIEHIERKFHGEDPNQKRKKVFVDYSKYPHDNNKKQKEARLNKQRSFVTKVLEQGYVWYVTYEDGERVWKKKENPSVEFRDNNYFLLTPCGNTCVKKEGRILSLEKPTNK